MEGYPGAQILGQLLLDEEGAEVRKLPSASRGEDGELDQSPSDNTRVGSLGLVTEFRFTFTLEHLLPPDILQPSIEVLDLLHNILNLSLIRALDLARLTDGNVKSESNSALRVVRQPTSIGGHVVRRKADLMLSAISGREGETAIGIAPLGDDSVVVVEGLVDGDEHVYARVGDVAVGWLIVDLRLVVSDNKSVLGQILEETFLFIRVHIEIQSVCGNGE